MSSEEDLPSCRAILGIVWRRCTKRFGDDGDRKVEKSRLPSGINVLGVLSVVQIILGFLCICIALVALSAAFYTKEKTISNHFMDMNFDMEYYYREQMENVIKVANDERKTVINKANDEKKKIIQFYQKGILDMKDNNCSWNGDDYPPSSKLPRNNRYGDGPRFVPQMDDYNSYDAVSLMRTRRPDYNSYGDEDKFVSQNSDNNYNGDGPQFISFCDSRPGYCYPSNEDHLIIEYLGVPGWLGIVLLITGLVGLRMVSVSKKIEYFQVSHSYTFLNIICAFLLAPGMLAVGILQMVFTGYYWDNVFRYTVGQVTTGFAGFIMLLSMVVCVVNCCCPWKPKSPIYKELRNVVTDGEKMKENKTEEVVVEA